MRVRIKQKQSQGTGKVFNKDAGEEKWEVLFSACYVPDAIMGILQTLSHLILIITLQVRSSSTIYRWGIWGPEMFITMPKVVKLGL